METIIKLTRNYGASYFGSGGGYGSVCLSNCRTTGKMDNGFCCGPAAVEVINPDLPARFYARGGDCIGDGRDWAEAGEYVPGTGWVAIPGYKLADNKAARQAWLHALEG